MCEIVSGVIIISHTAMIDFLAWQQKRMVQYKILPFQSLFLDSLGVLVQHSQMFIVSTIILIFISNVGGYLYVS